MGSDMFDALVTRMQAERARADAAERRAEEARAEAERLRGALGEMVDPDDGHIQACGNGGEDPENCSPLCVRVRAALSGSPASPSVPAPSAQGAEPVIDPPERCLVCGHHPAHMVHASLSYPGAHDFALAPRAAQGETAAPAEPSPAVARYLALSLEQARTPGEPRYTELLGELDDAWNAMTETECADARKRCQARRAAPADRKGDAP